MGRWILLRWFAATERILEPEELTRLLERWGPSGRRVAGQRLEGVTVMAAVRFQHG